MSKVILLYQNNTFLSLKIYNNIIAIHDFLFDRKKYLLLSYGFNYKLLSKLFLTKALQQIFMMECYIKKG